MLLLMLFALIAGAGTAITPCVLPVVPALLASSATGGRRRPIGIVHRAGATFTIAIVAAGAAGQGRRASRAAPRGRSSIVVLIAFGVVLLIPELSAASRRRFLGWPVRTEDAAGPASGRGSASVRALGFVCAPCAGPILAAVTSVSASSGANARVVLVAIAYAVGLLPCCCVYAFAGRAVIDRIRRSARPHGRARPRRRVAGDRRADGLQPRRPLRGGARQGHQPAGDSCVDPTRSLENSNAVQNRLASLRPTSRFAERQKKASTSRSPRRRARASRSRASRRRRSPSSAPRPSSPTTRTGSTPPATSR